MRLARRTSAWIVAGLCAGSAVLAVASLIVGAGAADMSAAPATVDVPPSTVAPVTDPPATPGSAVRPSTTAEPESPRATQPAPTSTTLPTSPLAAYVGAPRSAAFVPAVARPIPVRIAIEALGMAAPIVPVGVQADGQLEIPDETAAGWYRFGSRPGEPGATVIAAHVNWHHVDGPFAELRRLEPGAIVTVELDDGTTRTYSVVERQQYDKGALPTSRIWTRAGAEELVLITCGGSFNPEIHRYRDNIVVYAVAVA